MKDKLDGLLDELFDSGIDTAESLLDGSEYYCRNYQTQPTRANLAKKLFFDSMGVCCGFFVVLMVRTLFFLRWGK